MTACSRLVMYAFLPLWDVNGAGTASGSMGADVSGALHILKNSQLSLTGVLTSAHIIPDKIHIEIIKRYFSPPLTRVDSTVQGNCHFLFSCPNQNSRGIQNKTKSALAICSASSVYRQTACLAVLLTDRV